MSRNNRTVDRVQAVWNILGGEDGIDRLIRGEVTVSEPERTWHEQYNVIYFSVTSDGTTGEEWIERLEDNEFRVSDDAKKLLRSTDFKPTEGVTTKITVLKGMLFSDNDRFTENIRAEADRRGLTEPNAEVACLIREKFTDEELEAMGLWWIVAMHESFEGPNFTPPEHGRTTVLSADGPHVLGADRYYGRKRLLMYHSDPDITWACRSGFAFVVSQV